MIQWRRLIEAASGDVRRLSSVVRYSSIPIVCQENVAEHSYWVALYALMIHQAIEHDQSNPPDPVVISAILSKALIHDMAECVTGDVVRTFKYSSEKLKKAIDEAEDNLVSQFPSELTDLYFLCSKLKSLTHPESSLYVDAVVKAADFLSLHQYMRREILRGNDEIRPFYHRMIEDLHKMSEKETIRPLKDLYHDMAVESELRTR